MTPLHKKEGRVISDSMGHGETFAGVRGGSTWTRLPRLAATLVTMHARLNEIGDVEEFDRLLAASGERPLLVFKYSATCGTSAKALDELLDHLNEHPANATYAIVTVQTHRDVSNAIARTLGIRHETPQMLLIRDGRLLWNASHYRVTSEAVEDALNAVLNAPDDTASQPTLP